MLLIIKLNPTIHLLWVTTTSFFFHCNHSCWFYCLFNFLVLEFSLHIPQEMTFSNNDVRRWVPKSSTCRRKAEELVILQYLFLNLDFFSESLPSCLPPPPNYVASGYLNPSHSCSKAFSTLSICLFVFLGFSFQSAILYKQNYPFMSYPFQLFLLDIVNCSICGACLLIIFLAS